MRCNFSLLHRKNCMIFIVFVVWMLDCGLVETLDLVKNELFIYTTKSLVVMDILLRKLHQMYHQLDCIEFWIRALLINLLTIVTLERQLSLCSKDTHGENLIPEAVEKLFRKCIVFRLCEQTFWEERSTEQIHFNDHRKTKELLTATVT